MPSPPRMSIQHSDLLARLDAFSLDEPGVSLPFTHRLARENGWSEPFAARVVREYKRFVFLAMAAGHPVTPSDAVDQAWHLHLVYTRHYWEVMCRDLLGRPLHHGPTLGGSTEAAKFDDWYARTLESYRRLVGEEPPGDIWPPGEERFRPRRWQRIDRSQWWLVPRWRLPKGLAMLRLPALAGAACGLIGCAANPTGTGPSWGAFLPMLAGAGVMGWWLGRDRTPVSREFPVLDPFEIAVLAGGEKRAAMAALGSLHVRGVTTPMTMADRGFLLKRELTEADAPLERRALSLDHPPCFLTVRSVSCSLRGAAQVARRKLMRAGLLRSPTAVTRARWLSAAPFLPLLGFCALMGDGFVAAAAATLATAAVMAAMVPIRSYAGSALIQSLRQTHSRLVKPGRQTLLADPGTPGLAIALFGPACLASAGFSGIHSLLEESAKPAGSSSHSSGCGSGSDSGWFFWDSSDSGCGSDGGSGCGSSGCGGGCGGD